MRINRKKLILIMTVLFLMSCVMAASQINRIILVYFSRAYNLDIAYESIKGSVFNKMEFERLKVINRSSGTGISSRTASVSCRWKRVFLSGCDMLIDLRDVNFLKNYAENPMGYSSIPDLVSSPFNSNWRYRKISADCEIKKDKISIRHLEALGDEIHLFFTGTIYRDNRVESDIRILFSNKITSRIPEELSNAVLQDEPEGWKSLAVKLAGNYKDPSIQVSGKLFRLNIKSISAVAQ